MAGAGAIKSLLLGCDWLTASPNLTSNHGHSPGAGKLQHCQRGWRKAEEGRMELAGAYCHPGEMLPGKGSHKIVNSFDQMKAAMESIFTVLPAIRVWQDLVAETPWTALTHLATPWLLKHCRYPWEQHCYPCLHTSKPAIAQKCHFEQSLVCLEGSSMMYSSVSQSTISKASMFLCRDKLFKFFFVP